MQGLNRVWSPLPLDTRLCLSPPSCMLVWLYERDPSVSAALRQAGDSGDTAPPVEAGADAGSPEVLEKANEEEGEH